MPDDVILAAPAEALGDPSLRVKGLDHIVLRVADIDCAIDFYGRVLGCHVERRLAEKQRRAAVKRLRRSTGE